LLASSIEGLKNEKNIADAFRKRMRKRLGDILITVPLKPQPPEIRKALECILYQLEPDSDLIPPTAKKKLNGILEKDIYDPSHYCSSDGRLTILQIFDKKDTGNDHWNMSNDWFHKYAPPKKGEDGENIYDFPIGLGYRDSPKNARVIHFMGETPEKNQEFIKKMLQDYPNMIISFRGHSYSLNRSFPDDIFGNSTGHILFIPGSCGSSGAIPNYIANNPKTDIRFIANTSTGKGQVTNQIVEILFTSGREFKSSGSDFYITAMDSFEDLIMKNAEKLEKQGGNPSTIKAWSPGEILLNYVQTP